MPEELTSPYAPGEPEPVRAPEAARTKGGQLCVSPPVMDALFGLGLLVLPLLAPVLWLMDEETVGPKGGWFLAFAVAYGISLPIALRGFLSDASPFRMTETMLPARLLALAAGWAIGLPFAVALIVAPGSEAAQEAALRGQILGTPAPSPGETPDPPSYFDLWVAIGNTVPGGRVLFVLAMACLAVLLIMYIRARREQLQRFPVRSVVADGAELEGAELEGAELEGAELEGAEPERADGNVTADR